MDKEGKGLGREVKAAARQQTVGFGHHLLHFSGCLLTNFSQATYLYRERWLSGRKQRFAKSSRVKVLRGFESPSLRHFSPVR